ncbi:uncharacterized protein CANTADRAFT_48288 [Suhomyces tanzawaensis NRRL Y-17324]|uniref:diphosphoinositol-polyphosphate diphosphatase n=1 Tax=Suhomyces tanzawaensis NRRL Y-17324 TaxID=984487 RepID=A0A1E4SNX4_9ASCO|nr:uncharacterized protein CANTADRAFT_48288 [Suhomyces tanzawaensis NRRL Y-17324]ODV81230.1 hypothetical protein CANTADRAFT_48288 [Suhomyces tanzawaensis NRRL Y-17324]
MNYDEPFQMDEELPGQDNVVIPSQSLSDDITPRYTDPTSSIYYDHQLIRSKLAHLRLDTGNNTTTEDESVDEVNKSGKNQYDEDIDDNLDLKLQSKLNQEYHAKYDTFDVLTQPLAPPENFAPVINKIYRSSFPQPNNFSFLKKLKLKSIFCLIPEEYPELQAEFLKHENIKLFQLGMSGNKEPFVKISSELITEAIKVVIDPANHPILIHCNRGKHRTGCLVGVLRRLQKWSLTIIFDEYRKFAAPKERPMDQQFIELYDETEIIKYAEENNLLPLAWE